MKMGYEAGVFWQSGKAFHGEWYIRMNLALPNSRVREAFDRLDNTYSMRKDFCSW